LIKEKILALNGWSVETIKISELKKQKENKVEWLKNLIESANQK